MPISYGQKYVLPALRRFFWAQEPVTAGTSIAANSASWFLEPADIMTALMRERYDATAEPVGLPVMSIDEIELTHHTEITVSSPMRLGGFHAYALASMMGDVTVCGSADTVSGAGDPYLHTIVPGIKGARQNTFSLVHDTGAATAARGDNSLLMTYCTVQSVAMSFVPNQPLMCTTSLMGSFPASAYATALASQVPGKVAAPSAAVGVTPATRALSYQGTFHVKANAGATDYPSAIISGDLTISKPADLFYTSSQNIQSPTDFQSGPFSIVSNLTALFDDIASGSLFLDYLKDQQAGSSANPNTMRWTDTDAHFLELQFFPAKWDGVTFADGGQSRQLSGTLTAYQAYAQATQSSPILTVPKQLLLSNAVSGAMIS
jgi:hypothetical protein